MTTARMTMDRSEAATAATVTGWFIAGADAEVENLELVCQGRQTIEVLKARAPLARTAAELAHGIARGDDLSREVTSIVIGGRPVRLASVRVELITAARVKPVFVDAGLVRADELPACEAPRLIDPPPRLPPPRLPPPRPRPR